MSANKLNFIARMICFWFLYLTGSEAAVISSIKPHFSFSDDLPSGWPENGLVSWGITNGKNLALPLYLKAINSAEEQMDISMYLLRHPDIIDALIKKAKSGVKIRVYTDPKPDVHANNDHSGVPMATPIERLQKAKIETMPVDASSHHKRQAHQKFFIIDNKWGHIMSGNWGTSLGVSDTPSTKSFGTGTRDFGITVTNPEILKELQAGFDALWAGNEIGNDKNTFNHPNLLWGPIGQRQKIEDLINGAKKSLVIYQQCITDESIKKTIINAIQRGVTVQLMMVHKPFDKQKKHDRNLSSQVDLLKEGQSSIYGTLSQVHLNTLDQDNRIHAKIIVVDEQLAYVGSCNFYTPSLEQHHELGLLTVDQAVINNLFRVFDLDWKASKSLSEFYDTQKKNDQEVAILAKLNNKPLTPSFNLTQDRDSNLQQDTPLVSQNLARPPKESKKSTYHI